MRIKSSNSRFSGEVTAQVKNEGHCILLKSLKLYKWLIKYFENSKFTNWKGKVLFWSKTEPDEREYSSFNV